MKLEIRNLKFITAGAVGLLLATGAFAADVQMTLEPELISLLDRAVLKIEFIDTKGEAADIPDVDGLKIDYRGPQTQYSFVNGRSSSSITHTYLVTPTKVGDYTIGPVRIKYKGGEKVLSAKLRVIKPKDDAEAQKISEIMFSRISTDHPAPYVHEPFNLDLKVYVRDGVQLDGNFGIRGGLPESGMDGELNWDITQQKREELKGTIFNVYTLHATAKALTAGPFMFAPEVQLNVVVPRQQRRSWGFDDPFFGDFFGRQETRPIILDCNHLNVDVQPIPLEGRPSSFTGGVGKMNFDVDVGPTQLKAGEPVTLKMQITGTGNLEKITPPHLEEQPGLKLYEARSVPTENPGEALFEQVVIPTSDSIKEVPAISFTYFNTQTVDFRTITQGPFPITVEAAAQQSATMLTAMSGAGQQKTEVLGHDIAYLKSRPAKWHTMGESTFLQTPLSRIAMTLPALLVAIAGLVVRRRDHLASDVARARRQKAPKAARHNIKLAENAMKKNDAPAFYEAIWNALAEYFGHRLNLAPGQVTLDILMQRIPDWDETIEQLFSRIEQRRYGIQSGKEHSREEMNDVLNQLGELLKKSERMKI